jgi:hypothetical protein
MSKNLKSIGNIITTKDFNDILKLLNTADQDTLVVFDVDEVLFSAVDQVLKQHQYFSEKISTLAVQDDLYELCGLIYMQRQVKPVDDRFVAAIEALQKNGIRAIALTNCYTEKLGPIASVKDWRINELKSHGYHFELSWEETSEKKFENIPTEEMGIFPIFKEGVLFTNNVSKGSVLDAFLKFTEIKPRKIIFIDDRLEYIESVDIVAKALSIPLIGIQYTAAAVSENDFCLQRAELQFEILAKERKWISDIEADERKETQ